MDLERELALHYESTIRAIENGRIGLAKRRLEAYPRFAESFLDTAAHRGVLFSASTALSASILDWPTPTQIGRYAQRAITAAMRSRNAELISEAAYVPVRFLRLSVAHKEFLFYLDMLRIYPNILSLVYDSSLVSTRDLIVDRSWRPLRDFSHYWLLAQTKDVGVDLAAKYVSLVLWTYSDLLKVAMDHGDTETFGLIGRELNRLFDSLEIHWTQTNERNALRDLVTAERRLIWFGLGAWVVRSRVLTGARMRPGQPDQKLVDLSQIGSFMEVIANNFRTIRGISDTYLQARTGHYDGTHWERWLWQTLQEGVVQTLDFDQWLTRYYSLEGLRLVMTGAKDSPRPHGQLRFYIDDIELFLREVKENPQKWTDFIPNLGTALLPGNAGMSVEQATDQFLRANRSAIQEWNRSRDNQVIQVSLERL